MRSKSFLVNESRILTFQELKKFHDSTICHLESFVTVEVDNNSIIHNHRIYRDVLSHHEPTSFFMQAWGMYVPDARVFDFNVCIINAIYWHTKTALTGEKEKKSQTKSKQHEVEHTSLHASNIYQKKNQTHTNYV